MKRYAVEQGRIRGRRRIEEAGIGRTTCFWNVDVSRDKSLLLASGKRGSMHVVCIAIVATSYGCVCIPTAPFFSLRPLLSCVPLRILSTFFLLRAYFIADLANTFTDLRRIRGLHRRFSNFSPTES